MRRSITCRHSFMVNIRQPAFVLTCQQLCGLYCCQDSNDRVHVIAWLNTPLHWIWNRRFCIVNAPFIRIPRLTAYSTLCCHLSEITWDGVRACRIVSILRWPSDQRNCCSFFSFIYLYYSAEFKTTTVLQTSRHCRNISAGFLVHFLSFIWRFLYLCLRYWMISWRCSDVLSTVEDTVVPDWQLGFWD